MIAPGFYPDTVPDFDPSQAHVARAYRTPDELRLMSLAPIVPFVLSRVPATEEWHAIPPYRPSRVVSLLTSQYGDDALSNRLGQMLARFEAGRDGVAQLASEASELGFGDLPPQAVVSSVKEALRQRTYELVRELADFVLKRGDLWVSMAVLEPNVARVPYLRVAPLCGLAIAGCGDDWPVRAVVRGKTGVVGKAATVLGVFETQIQI